MKRWKTLIISLTIISGHCFFIENSSRACSAFGICKGNRIVAGKNLDWICDLGFLVVNKRDVPKRTFLKSGNTVFEWTSKYGSITFTQNGVGFTSGGMNEAGLVIEESWLGQTRYPAPDNRPVIDEIQWIQYQLDRSATVEEVIKTNPKLRIQKYFGESHYFVYDRSGKAAAIDFLNGDMVYHIMGKADVQVLTNDTYQTSCDSLKTFEGFGGNRIIPRGANSLHRFARAARMIHEYANNDSTNVVDYGFRILSNISQRSTVWSVVYDITNFRIYYRTASSPEIKEVSFDKFDFNRSSPIMLIDLNIQKQGDISELFERYTTEKNRDLFTRVISSWRANKFATNITDDEAEKIVRYPETLSPVVTDIDGNVYHTVTIGTQTWMLEDLKTTRYRNGDAIGTTNPAALDIDSEHEPKYQWAYNGDESNVATFGRLYTWYATTDKRNIAPVGWHVPTTAEWGTLISFLGGEKEAQGKLKETGTEHWNSPNTDATNESGFTALPGGNRFNNEPFIGIGDFTHWWTSTEYDTKFAWRRTLWKNAPMDNTGGWANKNIGWLIRCIKD